MMRNVSRILFVILFCFITSVTFSQSFFSKKNVWGTEVTPSPGNTFIVNENTLSFSSSAIAKYDSAGMMIWRKNFSSPGLTDKFTTCSRGIGSSVVLSTTETLLSSGNIIEEMSLSDFDENTLSLFPQGIFTSNNPPYRIQPNKIVPLSGGNCIVFCLYTIPGAEFLTMIGLNGGPVWIRTFSMLPGFYDGMTDFVRDSSGNIAFITSSSGTFIKVDTLGSVISSFLITKPSGAGFAYNIEYVNGNYLVTYSNGYLCMFSETGNVVFAKQIQGVSTGYGSLVCADSSSGFYISTRVGNFTNDVVSHFDSSGTILWSKQNIGFDPGPLQKTGNSLYGFRYPDILFRTNFNFDSICYSPVSIPVTNNVIFILTPATFTADSSSYMVYYPNAVLPSIANGIAPIDYCVTVSIENKYIGKNHFSLAPNPASNILTITSENLSMDEVIIYEMTGRKVKSFQILHNNKQYTINVNDLSQGPYFIHVKTTDNLYYTQRFFKN